MSSIDSRYLYSSGNVTYGYFRLPKCVRDDLRLVLQSIPEMERMIFNTRETCNAIAEKINVNPYDVAAFTVYIDTPALYIMNRFTRSNGEELSESETKEIIDSIERSK